MSPRDVPIPRLMLDLPRDRRGYPIPVMVLRDTDGRPHFTVNDEAVRQKMIRADRCTICGNKLLRGRWFVGGPRSAFDPRGAYYDPPLHKECAEYALQVCPWLAAPIYARRLEGATLDADKMPEHVVGLVDRTQIPDRPSFFVAVMATGQVYMRTNLGLVEYVRPKRPYVSVQFWRAGLRIDESDAEVAAFISGLRPDARSRARAR